MRFTRIRTAACLALGTSIASAALIAGCENAGSKADKEVAAKVEQAESSCKTQQNALDASHAAPPPSPVKPRYAEVITGMDDAFQAKHASLLDRLVNDLEAASKVPNATPEAKCDVKRRQAHDEVDLGDALVQAADDDETEIAHLAGLARAIGMAVSSNNVKVSGLLKLTPDEAVKNIEQSAAAAKGTSETSTWGEDGIPSQAMVDAEKAKLKAEIDQVTHDRDELDKKQKDATQKQHQLAARAEKTKGEEARTAGLAAAASKKEAAEAADQLEAAERKLAVLNDQLAVKQARATALTEADAAFTARKDAMNVGWEDVKKQVETLRQKSKSLIEGGGTGDVAASDSSAGATTQPDGSASAGPQDLTSLAQSIKDLAEKADHARDEALKHYESAAADVKAAQASAGEVVKIFERRKKEAPQAAETMAWDQMIALFAVCDFDVELAKVDMKIARVHEDRADRTAMIDGLRKELAPVLESAGATMPAALAGMPADQAATDLRKQGDEAYTLAEDLLAKVIDASPAPPKTADCRPAAHELRIAEKYTRAQYAFHAGDNDRGTTDLGDAKRELADLNSQGPLPASIELPTDLAEAIHVFKAPAPLPAAGTPVPAAGAPSTEPSATAPTTAPADAGGPTIPASPATPPADSTPPATPAAPATPPADSTPPATPATPATPPADSTPPATPATPATPPADSTPPATPATPATPPADSTPPATPAAPATPPADSTPPATPATPPAAPATPAPQL